MILIVGLAVLFISGVIMGISAASIPAVIYRRPMVLAVGGVVGAISAVPAFALMGLLVYVIDERHPMNGASDLRVWGMFMVGAGCIIFICSLLASLLAGRLTSRRDGPDTLADYQRDAPADL